jgi:hypothetical protein
VNWSYVLATPVRIYALCVLARKPSELMKEVQARETPMTTKNRKTLKHGTEAEAYSSKPPKHIMPNAMPKR